MSVHPDKITAYNAAAAAHPAAFAKVKEALRPFLGQDVLTKAEEWRAPVKAVLAAFPWCAEVAPGVTLAVYREYGAVVMRLQSTYSCGDYDTHVTFTDSVAYIDGQKMHVLCDGRKYRSDWTPEKLEALRAQASEAKAKYEAARDSIPSQL